MGGVDILVVWDEGGEVMWGDTICSRFYFECFSH